MNLKQITPNFIKSFYRYKLKKEWINKLYSLNIEGSGVEDGLSFIKIDNQTLYGYQSDAVLEWVYKLFLKKTLKSKLKPEALGLALDVVYRNQKFASDEETLKNNKFINLKEGDIVVEGGAFIGLYALQISHQVGDSGKVIAIEAIEENFKVLKKNIEVNNIKNIIPYNCAIWEKEEVLTFYRTNRQIASFSNEVVSDSTKQELKVDAKRLDTILKDLNIDKVDYVRLQLNGAEPNGLIGMEETLKQKPGLIVTVPYTLNNNKIKDLVENYLKQKGFKTSYWGSSVFVEKS